MPASARRVHAPRAVIEPLEGRRFFTTLPGSYHLTFDDEFNSLNLSTYDDSGNMLTSGWLTRDQNDYTGYDPADGNSLHYANPAIEAYNPFSINNGVLSITAEPTPAVMQGSGPGQTEASYVSGMLSSAQGGQPFNTSNGFSQTYGYFEMRCEVPAGAGMWPAFWMLPEPNLNTSNTNAEYDIFEIPQNADTTQNENTKTIYETEHFNGSQQQVAYSLPAGQDASTGFHTYGFEWDGSNVRWYVDGVLTATMTNVSNTPMYLLMNLDIGGDWPGQPNSSTVFPASFKIDYVRVYSDSDADAAVQPQAGYSVDQYTQDVISVVPEPVTGSAVLLGVMYLAGRRPRERRRGEDAEASFVRA